MGQKYPAPDTAQITTSNRVDGQVDHQMVSEIALRLEALDCCFTVVHAWTPCRR